MEQPCNPVMILGLQGYFFAQDITLDSVLQRVIRVPLRSVMIQQATRHTFEEHSWLIMHKWKTKKKTKNKQVHYLTFDMEKTLPFSKLTTSYISGALAL